MATGPGACLAIILEPVRKTAQAKGEAPWRTLRHVKK